MEVEVCTDPAVITSPPRYYGIYQCGLCGARKRCYWQNWPLPNDPSGQWVWWCERCVSMYKPLMAGHATEQAPRGSPTDSAAFGDTDVPMGL